MPTIPPPPTVTAAPLNPLDNFQPYVQNIKWRLALCVQGMQKRGKTHFALTAPGPIVVFTTDPAGLDRVKPADKFPGKDIRVHEIPAVAKNGHPDIVKEAAGKAWQELKRLNIAALDSARTVVYDSFTDIWLLARLAEFGKDKGVKGIHYSGINAEFLEFSREFRTRNANLILLHKEGEERDDDGKIINGLYKREGFGKLEFAVDDVIRCYREDPDKFSIQVLDSQNPAINGKVFPSDPQMAFATVAMAIFPNTTPDMWL